MTRKSRDKFLALAIKAVIARSLSSGAWRLAVAEKAKTIPINTEQRKLTYSKMTSQKQTCSSYHHLCVQLSLTNFCLGSMFTTKLMDTSETHTHLHTENRQTKL